MGDHHDLVELAYICAKHADAAPSKAVADRLMSIAAEHLERAAELMPAPVDLGEFVDNPKMAWFRNSASKSTSGRERASALDVNGSRFSCLSAPKILRSSIDFRKSRGA
jgi:hypothetical protein